MTDHFSISSEFDASPEALFELWTDPVSQAEFTGGAASNKNEVGGTFTAYDEYIWGTNISIEKPRHLIQSWRTTEFSESDPDSRLEIIFEASSIDPTRTKITLNHTNIPEGQGDSYRQGWIDYYFEPLRAYLDRSS